MVSERRINKLSGSFFIYFLNIVVVLACLGSVIYAGLNHDISESSLAIISGFSGTIVGSIMTILISCTRSDKLKQD